MFLSASVFSSANIKNPTKMGEGFENVNNRMEYKYHGYKGEQIWHEFGRPFWRANQKPKTVEAPAPKKIIKQITKEKRSATMRSISKNYDAKKKTLTLDVKFQLNKANIQSDYTTAIDKLGMALKEDKDLKVEVQGHTDTTGARSYNVSLSDTRAESVKKYLMNKFEIDSARIRSKGYGPAQPIATNKTLDGRKQNRRVDIKILQ